MCAFSFARTILLATLIATSFGLYIQKYNPQGSHSLVRRATCGGFSGNPDLYGLGIRLGIYLQWISSLLTNSLLPEGVSDSLDTNSIFLFAVFIAIAAATNASEGLRPVEAFIMLQLCFGYLLSVLSVSGLKLILLSDAHSLDPEHILSYLRQFSDSVQSFLHLDRPDEVLHRPDRAALQELIKTSFSKPPTGVFLSNFQRFLIRYLDILAIYSMFPETYSGTSGSILVSSLEPVLWMTDFSVLLYLRFDSTWKTPDNPMKAYRRERMLSYKEKRKFALEYGNPQLFSIAMTSPYKDDRISWLGVLWRSCLVAGIGIYNVWFWFTGAELLETEPCPTYIFLFCKASMLGPARTFFKILSIVYMTYAGSLIISGWYSMLAFFGTTIRSLLINFLIMPYVKLLLIAVSAGSDVARRHLDNFEETRSDFLRWLDIPNARQLLSAFAYLSSNPEETVVSQSVNLGEKPVRSMW